MPCYLPLDAYHAPGGISFDRKKSFGIPLQLPCGRCIGCRLEKAKQWALRCHHEASMYKDNDFITLTYATEHLPKNYSLDKDAFPKFIRALRKKTKRQTKENPIRYYMCGEYGNICCEHGGWTEHAIIEKPEILKCNVCTTGRPHYHAIIFNYKFPNQKLVSIRNKNRVYTSDLLTKLWPYGGHEIGNVSFTSAGYVARYILKKQNGEFAERDYSVINTETGELTNEKVTPPFTTMSLRPGIGESWYKRFKMDLFPHDYAILPDGRQTPVPTYYRDLLKKDDPGLYQQLRALRIEKARNNPDNTPERIETRHYCQLQKAKRLKREL